MDPKTMRECEWCGGEPTVRRRDPESGGDTFLCRDCVNDLDYCQRRGKEPLRP